MTYRPREDSFILKEYLESLNLNGKRVLDMGTGSGILAVAAAKNGADVVAADIDSVALEDAKEKAAEKEVSDKISFVESNLFENISESFNLIVFNPPYLPGKKYDDLQGGETGIEITERFLENAEKYLEEGGETAFIASDRSEIDSLSNRFELEKVKEKNLWFETLYLFRISD